MATLYNKNGKKYNVPHAVDVKDWINSGDYSLENPKKSKPTTKKTKEVERVVEPILEEV